jgi:hypothetical protein
VVVASIRDNADDDLGRSTTMASLRLEPDMLYQYPDPDHTSTAAKSSPAIAKSL